MRMCAEEMAAIVESACAEYHKQGGKVADDYFQNAGRLLADLCHPPSFAILGEEWTPAEIAGLRDRLLSDAKKVDINVSPEFWSRLRTTAFILEALGVHLWREQWPKRDDMNLA